MPVNSSNEGLTCVSMTWRVMSLHDVAHHVGGCDSKHTTRVQMRVSMTDTWQVMCLADIARRVV